MENKVKLLPNKIVFARTKLGEAVFMKKGAKDAYGSISPNDWSISQLRTIADYMEANPKCSLFSDGSGHLCKK